VQTHEGGTEVLPGFAGIVLQHIFKDKNRTFAGIDVNLAQGMVTIARKLHLYVKIRFYKGHPPKHSLEYDIYVWFV
jgi:hypothetical protein